MDTANRMFIKIIKLYLPSMVLLLLPEQVGSICSNLLIKCKSLFTPSESGSERENDKRIRRKDQRINKKHQSKFSFLLDMNGS